MQNHVFLKIDYYASQIVIARKLCQKSLSKQQLLKLEGFEKLLKMIKKQIKEQKMTDLDAFNIYQSVFEEIDCSLRAAYLDFRLGKTDFEAWVTKEKIKEEELSKISCTKMEDKMLTSTHHSSLDIDFQNFSLSALCEKATSIFQSIKNQHDGMKLFIQTICSNYNIVPYHNFTHVFGVFLFFFQCSQMESVRLWIDDFELFYALIACLCHDLRHSGTNTLFEIKTRTNLAMTYHNNSIMQKMHVSRTMELLDRQHIENPYSHLAKDEKTRARRIITKSILATDMSLHYGYAREIGQRVLDGSKGSDRQFLIECLIHACDIGNPCMSYESYIYWANLICMEFNNQTKLQEAYSVEVTEFLKFNSLPYFYKNQLTFANNIVAPLWMGLSTRHQELEQFYNRIKENVKKLNESMRRNSEPPLTVFQSYVSKKISRVA